MKTNKETNFKKLNPHFKFYYSKRKNISEESMAWFDDLDPIYFLSGRFGYSFKKIDELTEDDIVDMFKKEFLIK